MATLQQHHIKAITPTWLLVKKVAPAPQPRDGAKKPAPAAAYSPLFLSPSVWQKAQDEKKSKDAGGLPASPRISCMGQVKGRRRRSRRECSNARGPPATATGSGHGRGVLATLVLGLFGRRNGMRTSRVRDLPRGGSASAPGSSHGGGSSVAAAAVGKLLDPPLPVVRRPARADDAPSLWERRRGGGKGLHGLRLTYIETETSS